MSVHAFDVKDPKHASVIDSAWIIAEMAGRLWEFRCGPHDKCAVERTLVAAGFWAVFIDTQNISEYDLCEECDEPKLSYTATSHAATLPEAVVLAARKAYDNDRANIEDR